MSQLLGFGASLLILFLYFLATFGLAVSVVLILSRLLAKPEDKQAVG